MNNGFVNKVAESGIITINLEDFFPQEEIMQFDMKAYLFMGLILKEKEFREALKQLDVSVYQNKIVALTCSTDAIVPVWAYMLVTSILKPVAKDVIYGLSTEAEQHILLTNIKALDEIPYTDQRIVIKGCGEKPIPDAAYVAITQKLRPVAKSIMYGEPCSTVPIFKKPIVKS
ncbi:MAG TPA: DUF2480 family protein [Ferruginibacter sp.]|jgi:hypothetical protein|nr:DUF2480 family protein [Bacteroidota bacterium]MBS1924991.1 DUF2480 family protein [Bacteroidota bacterium]MCC6692540.1 DUF2480 family protein [Chitinophagaceae bacterium]HMT95201.1 DUF2480 family protein [Ferruginibacter sp.]HMU24658.1 DUF2480 family protein [Ferruginibacter sp.]